MRRKLGVLIMVFLLTLLIADNALAKDSNDDPQSGVSMCNENNGAESRGFKLRSRSVDPYTGLSYTHRYADSDIVYGIDVSSHNGSIDWGAVKSAGIRNVMIRAAYRGYGSAGNLRKDVNFETNIRGASAAGLNVGAYIFSQAINTEEAVEEANYLLSQIKNYNITLPVVIDYEYADTGSGTGGRLYNAHLSVSAATNNCLAFCRRIAASGYTPMIYANKSMLEDQLNAGTLSQNARIWLANYTTNTSYRGKYDVWQYSSKGRVNGISGYVDCNFWYGEEDLKAEPDTVYQGVDYSAVYDYNFYVSTYADLKNAFGSDKSKAIAHFVNTGMNEGRQGKDTFNVSTYRNRYPDLRNAFGNNLKSYYLHYMNHGIQEGRSGAGIFIPSEGGASSAGFVTFYQGIDYSAVYDFNYYRNKYGDIKDAFGTDDYRTLQHFVVSGMAEGRQGIAGFDVRAYRSRYKDLQSVLGNNLKSYYLHYIHSGKRERRNGNSLSSAEMKTECCTVYSGIDYASVYNYSFYIETYPDLKRVFGNDDYAALQHFVLNGMAEGRQGSPDFNVYIYKRNYSDLQSAFGNNLKSYYLHYVSSGKSEKRIAVQKR